MSAHQEWCGCDDSCASKCGGCSCNARPLSLPVMPADALADDLHRMHAEQAIDLDRWPAAREWLTSIGRSER